MAPTVFPTFSSVRLPQSSESGVSKSLGHNTVIVKMVSVKKRSASATSLGRPPTMGHCRRRFVALLLTVALVGSLILLSIQCKALLMGCKSDAAMKPYVSNYQSRSEANAMDTTSLLKTETFMTCSEITKKLKQRPDPLEINELRRHLALSDDVECFDKHFDFFAKKFYKRMKTTKYYHFIIPESMPEDFLCQAWGGQQERHLLTSRKRAVKERPCRYKDLGAYWSYACRNVTAPACRELDAHPFVTNERWLDHYAPNQHFCLDRVYSIAIREPTVRAMRQVNAWFHDYMNHVKFDDYRGQKLNIMQSNYMTWILVAGKTFLENDIPINHQVSLEDLSLAKKLLSRFDVIIDLNNTASDACLEQRFKLMGAQQVPKKLDDDTDQSMNKDDDFYDDLYWQLYNYENYAAMNAIDIQLYQYAQELIRVDCEYLERMNQ